MAGRNGHESKRIGAVLVVGGGIGGMQASLDLAESGLKVYMVEAADSIGGKMAQLDKTFPTNDCAMCTISPKLVECGRHLNIEIITGATVDKLEGEAGNFLATVRQKPRYIDLTKCTGCGECALHCPVKVPDRFNEGMGERRAVYKMYPQAVPNAFAIEKKGRAPCKDACPVNQAAQGYVALVREKRYDDAFRVIKDRNPFPGICGRICNHRCEDNCNRAQADAAVSNDGLPPPPALWDGRIIAQATELSTIFPRQIAWQFALWVVQEERAGEAHPARFTFMNSIIITIPSGFTDRIRSV